VSHTVAPLPPQTKPTPNTEPGAENRIWRIGVLVVTGLVVSTAHLPQLVRLGATMWAKEHYQFFPLVLIGAAYLAWVRRDLYFRRAEPSIGLAGFNWMVTLLIFSGGVLLDSPWLVGLSAVSCVWSGSYSLGGRSWLARSLPVMLFLLIALPLPSEYDVKLINWLQEYVTVKSSELFDYLGYYHMRDGVNLTFVQRTFKVDRACSGIHSLFAALCCTVFYLALTRRALFRYFYIIPAAFFWVIVANILRILLVCLLSMEFDLPVVEGPGHTLLGVFVFVFSLGMIFSTDRLFLFVLPLRLSEGLPQSSSNTQTAAVRFPRLHFGALFAAVFLMISFGFLGGLSVVRADLFQRELDLTLGEEDCFSLPGQSLPQEWNGWVLANYQEESREFDNPMGAYSQSWTYAKQNKVCLFSVSSPFPAWHDLAVCYQNIGWNVVKQEDLVYPQSSPYQGERTELTLRRDGEGYQYVLFSAFDVERQSVPVPKLYRVKMTRRFMDEIKMFSQSVGLNQRSATPPIYQMQLLVKTRAPLSESQLQQCRELFGQLRELAREKARRGPVNPESEE